MSWFKRKDLLDQAFLVGIVLKGLDGVLEVVGGLLLLILSPATIYRVTLALTQHELSPDPHDFIATHLLHATSGLTGSAVQFGADLLAIARRRQDRSGHGPAEEQTLGLPLDDCVSHRVHRLPGLSDDLRAFRRSRGADHIRCLCCLAHIQGVRQAADHSAHRSTSAHLSRQPSPARVPAETPDLGKTDSLASRVCRE